MIFFTAIVVHCSIRGNSWLFGMCDSEPWLDHLFLRNLISVFISSVGFVQISLWWLCHSHRTTRRRQQEGIRGSRDKGRGRSKARDKGNTMGDRSNSTYNKCRNQANTLKFRLHWCYPRIQTWFLNVNLALVFFLISLLT